MRYGIETYVLYFWYGEISQRACDGGVLNQFPSYEFRIGLYLNFKK